MAISKRQWKLLHREQIKIQACYCYLCGKLIEKESELSIDHCLPLSRSGSDSPNNWRASHKVCNADKGALTYEEWLLYKELLRKKHGHIR